MHCCKKILQFAYVLPKVNEETFAPLHNNVCICFCFSHSDFTTSRIIRTKSRQFLARHSWRVASPSSTSNGEWKTKKILDTGGFLTSSKKRSGKTFPDAKIYNQARSPTISCLTWPHRCPGKYLLKLVYTTMG